MIALAFDFDGTIIDSERVKPAAFARLFAGLPEKRRIADYNSRTRGVSRREKLQRVCVEILHSSDPAEEVERLMIRYEGELGAALSGCRPIGGIGAFLESVAVPRFVVSSAPREEIEGQLARLDLASLFKAVYTYPMTKCEALRRLKLQYESVTFFGDAAADYEAAREADA